MGFSDKKLTKDQSEKWQEILLYAFIFAGVLIAIFVFFNNRSLWLDEAKLANNIVKRSFIELLGSLSRNQVAPIGFLYIEKLMVVIFGKKDWALSIFPLLSFIGSIPLFYSINRKLFKSKIFTLFSCGMFSLTTSLLMYSSEVKQYSTDVLVGLFVLWIALNYFRSKDKKTFKIYTWGGVLAIFFSNISVIMLFTVGIYSWCVTYRDNRKKLLSESIPIVIWLISFSIYYVAFIHNHRAQDMMVNYWSGSFLPQNIFGSDFYLFLFDKTKMVFGSLLGFSQFQIIPLVFFLLGIVLNIKSKKILFLTLTPLLLHLVLSSFQMYPFDRRLILYLAPFIIIICAQGIWPLFNFLNTRNKVISMLFLTIPLTFNLRVASNAMPFEHEEIKSSMKYLNENMGEDSKLYVSFGSKAAFKFYKRRYPNLKKRKLIIYGESSRGNWEEFDDQIDEVSSGDWLLFTHVYTNVYERLTDEKYFLKKSKNNGYKVLDKQHDKRSTVYKIEK